MGRKGPYRSAPTKGAFHLLVRTDDGDVETPGRLSRKQLERLRARLPDAAHHVVVDRSIIDGLRVEGFEHETLDELDRALGTADSARIAWRKHTVPGAKAHAPQPPQKPLPMKIPVQAWWMIMMLGLMLPAFLVAWIAACAWLQRQGVMSTKITSYTAIAGAAVVVIRWLAFARMLIVERAIDLAEDAMTFPAVTLFSLRAQRVAYRDIETVTQRRLSGHASEVILVMRDRSQLAIPGVFQWTLERIEKELNARLTSS